jgi:hypothetical protein
VQAPTTDDAAAAVVGTAEVDGDQKQQQQQVSGLQCVELPCLRFFLRREREIRAAYIPSLDDWLLTQHEDD